jgi:hypothetical protein
VCAYFVYLVLLSFPMTFSTSSWYFGVGFAAILVVLGLALYAFRLSLGSRPLFDLGNVED